MLCDELHISEEVFNMRLQAVIQNTMIIAEAEITNAMYEHAWQLVQDIDEKDVVYAAMAASLGALLWTEDKKLYRGLRRKKMMYVVNTAELSRIAKENT